MSSTEFPDDASPAPIQGDGDGDSGRLRNLVIGMLERMDQDSDGGKAALEDACLAHPDLEPRLRARLATLHSFDLIETGDSSPRRVGDFDLLERVGAGGMGIVYRARQRSLEREVAIKLIRPDALHVPGARERFARETSIVARLQHPGIVPIHTVGGDDELPYYAMELVPGCTLAEALEKLSGRSPDTLTGQDLLQAVLDSCDRCEVPLPGASGSLFEGTWEDACLRVVRCVADALEHAHGRGVLHRDLKPSNVMLTPQGRVLLVDFGLSRADGGEGVTRTTDQVGSLPYMPAELLRSGVKALAAHSDVYSLGVTLYELLTLRLPFAGVSAPATMMAIVEGRPVRPRSHHPGLSWEAETVCLSAMDRDPRRRYGSAAELASDLTNALEKLPLEARRAGAILRLRRWIKHRPGATIAILLAVLLPSISALMLGREAGRVRAALEQVSLQEGRASANRDHALQAIETTMLELDRDVLDNLPGMDAVRQSILVEVEGLCEGLLNDMPEDSKPALLAGRCDAVRAGIARRAYRHEDEQQHLVRAVARVEPWILEQSKDSFDVRHMHATWRGRLAKALESQGRGEEAAALALEVLGEYRGLLEEWPERDDVQAQLLVLLSGYVQHRRSQGERAGGVEEAEQLVHAGRALVARTDGAGARAMLAWLLDGLGALLGRDGRSEAAAEILEEALDLRIRLSEEEPADREYRQKLARSMSQLSSALMDLRQDERALQLMRRCVEETDRLLEDYPDHSPNVYGIADAQLNYGAALSRTGHRDEARACYDSALFSLGELLEVRPTDANLHRTVGTTLLNLASCEVDDGVPGIAQVTCAAALESLSEAARLAPDSDDIHSWLAIERQSRAKVLLALDDPAAAAEGLVATPALARHRVDRLRGCLKRLEECLERAGSGTDKEAIRRCQEAVRSTLVGIDQRGDMEGEPVVVRLRDALGTE